MSLSIDDLFSSQSGAGAKAWLLARAGELGLPVTSWQEGQPLRVLYAAVAQKFSDLAPAMVLMNMSGFLGFATGSWLTILAKQVYNVDRILAQAGTTSLSVTKSTAGNLGPYAPGALHFANVNTGKTYTNTTNVTILGSASPQPTPVPVISDSTGSAWAAAIGEITVQVTPLIGCTTTNAQALASTDDESDDSIRTRCTEKLATLGAGMHRDAYSYVARTTKRADGTVVDVTRVRVFGDSTVGAVNVIMAALNGAPTAPDLALCDTALKAAAPWGITVTTGGAAAQAIAISYTAWAYTTAPASPTIDSLVLAKLTAFFQQLPIGGATKTPGTPGSGFVFADTVKSVIESASPFIFAVTLGGDLVGGDVAIGSTKVATISGTPTFSVVPVAPPQ